MVLYGFPETGSCGYGIGDPHAVSFYNLDGRSYSNSFQVEATYPFFRGFTLTAAYRYTDAKTDYRNAEGVTRRLKKPLVSDYKGLLTASYQTPLKKWQFDLTGQFNGGGRMPTPDAVNPLWEPDFKAYTVVNAQITKYFRRWSIYVGAENLFDYKQPHPIIDAENPRGDNFDGSMVWGPVHGRKIMPDCVSTSVVINIAYFLILSFFNFKFQFNMIRLLAILICAVFTFSTAYAQDAKKKKETVTFFVEGMDCANCVKKIEKNIAFEKGVTDLKCDLSTRTAAVTYRADKTSKTKLASAFKKIGWKRPQ